MYGSILEMPGECFEFIALGQPRNRFRMRVVLRRYLAALLVSTGSNSTGEQE